MKIPTTMDDARGVRGISVRPVAELHADPANVRKHDQRNLDAIKASLQRFGQQKPIVVRDDGVVVAGNGTLAAARALGWKSIQCVTTDLTGADAVAYAIADNRTAELAAWDDDELAKQLAALQIDDEELARSTGFTDAEIEAMALPDFQPATIEDQSRLDEKKKTTCPECGHEFTP